jgi:geranylgeranyl diphosphate synthase type II
MSDVPDLGALNAYLASRRGLVEQALKDFWPTPERWPKALHEAAAWSLFGGGKRVRPVLALAAFEAVGGADDLPYDAVMPAACSVEMIHTYSLIHDDLPCMDDDDERRGRPTTHVRFGEALALLAGDALLTQAFRLISDRAAYRGAASAERIVDVCGSLAHAAGWLGMVGGQSIDLGFEGPVDDEEALAFLHRRKTGELFRFACHAGATLGDGTHDQIRALAEYGETLGLAFQIADDVLDDRQDQGERGADASETPSFTALLGEDAALQRAEALSERALDLLRDFGSRADPLRALAWYAVHRDH